MYDGVRVQHISPEAERSTMQKGSSLSFPCCRCRAPVVFSVVASDAALSSVTCGQCGTKYPFEDPTLQRQLQKFQALCEQILLSEEILSDASIGVSLRGGEEIKIPFRLLLTRFTPTLALKVGGEVVNIAFRFEPSADLPKETL